VHSTRLYECISEMKKGSPSGYDAETGEQSASSESSPGEPYEHPSLYRIRRSQEIHQFLRKTAAGEIVEEGVVPAQREALRQWAWARQQPWRGAMEAILFSGWIFDTLQPYTEPLEMAHPGKMKAICAGKKKSDTIDARTIADLVRCNLWPAC